jgi:O-antigen/teichoic acid export membrane protein
MSKNNLVSGASVYIIANVISSVIPFLLLPLFTHLLSPQEFGIIALFQVLLAGFGAFTGLSIHGAISVNFFKGSRDTFPQFVGVCLLILLGTSILMWLIIAAFGPYVSKFIGIDVYWIFLAVVASSAQFVVNVRLVIWQISGHPIKYGFAQIFFTAVNACASVYLIMILDFREDGRIWAIAGSTFIFSIFSMLTLYGGKWIKWKWSRGFFNEALAWGIPLIPHVVGTLFIFMADRVIISKQLGIESTGIYFVAIQITLPIVILSSSYNNAFRPWIYEKLSRGENATAVVVSYISMLIFLFIGISYSVIVSLMFPVFIADQYLESLNIAVILIIGNTLQALYYTVANYILYEGRTGILSSMTIVSGLIYVILGWSIVASFGLTGLSVLFGIISFLFFIGVWVISYRVSSNPWFNWKILKASFASLDTVFTLSKKESP